MQYEFDRVALAALAVAGLQACTIDQVSIGQTAGLATVEPAAGAARTASASRLEWPREQDCDGVLRQVSHLNQTGQLAAMSSSAPIALLIDDPTLSLVSDIPLPVTSQAQATVFDCLIVVGEAGMAPTQPRAIISERKLRSSYPSGTKRLVNPNYSEANGPEESARYQSNIISTGDPMLDIVGALADSVLIGLDAVLPQGEAGPVNDEPRYIEEPRLIPYSYHLAELEASRSAKIPVALVDQRHQSRHETELALRETQLFALTDDRHPDDPLVQHAPAARLVSTLQLRRWEESPPLLSVGNLIEHLKSGQQQTVSAANGQAGDYMPHKLFGAGKIETAARLPMSVEPAAGPGRSPSLSLDVKERTAESLELANGNNVIRLGDDEAMASFFVSPEYLVAPADALPMTALVPLKYPDGVKVYGLVEKRDPKVGLALVFTPRAGNPLKIADFTTEPKIRNEALAGQPLLIGGQVAGIWISKPIEGWSFVDGKAIRQFAKTPGLTLVSR